MDSVLSAAGLLLAVLGVLYGLWYPQVASALEINTKINPLDAAPQRSALREALWHRAVPLAVGALVLAVLLLPPVLTIISSLWAFWREGGTFSLSSYNPVGAFILAVELFCSYLAVHVALLARALRKKLLELKG